MIIRWICEKCNKKWIYPNKKCVYCKGDITKQIGRDINVIGITKVNIPSPMHPVIPYNVLLLQDEHGNKMPKKTMKNYKIGDKYKTEKAKTDGAVIIVKIKYDLSVVKELLELLKSDYIDENDKILIKPCVIEPAYAYQTVNTNPDLLDEIINYLKEKKVVDIIVGEQAMLGNDVMAAAKKSGILDICKKHEVKLVDLSKTEYIEKNVGDFNFRIAKEVIERKVINVPVMKTNSQIGISGAMENMVRVVDEDTQKRMFSGDIEKTLPKLLEVLPSFLTIGDATIGMHAQGPTSIGEPAFLNMVFVSKDAAALDSVFAEVGMLDLPQYFKEDNEIKIGNSNIKDIEIIGEELDAIKFNLKKAEKGKSPHPKINLIDGKANPSDFNMALKMSSKLIGLLGEEVNLVIGPVLNKSDVEGKDRLVAYGNDAIQSLKNLETKPIAEINEDIEDIEKIMLLKSILEDQNKKGITMKDKLKSKLAKFGAKVNKTF